MNKRIFIILVLAFFICTVFAPIGVCDEGVTYYVDATGGDDANSGTSPESAWKTIFKVSNYHFNPGDSILFKRGEVWRERLVITNSGAPNNPISYGAYGNGAKPMLLGSVERNAESDWVNEGSNIWATADPKDGNELLSNPSFDEDTDGWVFSVGSGADASLHRDTETYDSAPASVRIDCVSNAQGDGQSWLFVSSGGLHIEEGEWYVLSFKAKGSTQFDVYTINLLKSGVYNNYYSIKSRPERGYFQVTTEWKTFNVYFLADTTANDGQILLDLIKLPSGESVYIDTLSFQKCVKVPLYADVGNLIFDNEASVGVRVDFVEDLDAQGEFWFDSDTGQVKMYSTSNPADVYSDIECALGNCCYRDIWSEGSIVNIMADYVTIENLDLRYAGVDGIWCDGVGNVIIRGCDVSYNGGSLIYSAEYADFDFGPRTGFLRYGDGIMFWENAHDCTVEGCKIHDVYDEGISNQGEDTNNQYNLYYRNNLLWNCERSFNIWDRPESSNMYNIYVEGNVCVGAGFGWGHKQRPDPHGAHVSFWARTSSTDNIIVRNNVFYEAAYCDLYYDGSDGEWAGIMLDNNYYYQKSGAMFVFRFDIKYRMEHFSQYQREKGYDLHSVTGDKEVVKEAARELTRDEDIGLLNEIFTKTDEMEPTKNEGVALDREESLTPLWEPSDSTIMPPDSTIVIMIGVLLVIGVIVIGVIIYKRK